MSKMNKEELLNAFKKALKHKEEIRKLPEENWASEGIKGNVVFL